MLWSKIGLVTSAIAGLMSPADKTKLDATGRGVFSLVASQAATAAVTVLVGATYSVPANSAAIGTVYRIRVWYRFVSTVSPPTLTFRLTVAGVAVATIVVTSVSAAATAGGLLEGEITIRTTGAGGTLMAALVCSNNHGITNATNWNAQNVTISTAAIDTTAANIIEIDAKMTTAVAANTLTLSQGTVELVKV